jgi:CDP-diacylglycerol---glycerol-3-phosphate 3-phosphatidyltransferase
MNLPNKLTILRIIMIPFILIFMLEITWMDNALIQIWNAFVFDYGMIIAVSLFLLASLTDTMDGQIARKRGMITNMGKFLDPIADKLLVASVLIALVQRNEVSAVIAIIIISREFIVTGIRLLAADRKFVIAASSLGKVKTVVQVVAIIYTMVGNQIVQAYPSLSVVPAILFSTHAVLWLAVVLTVISGYDYVRRNIQYIRE